MSIINGRLKTSQLTPGKVAEMLTQLRTEVKADAQDPPTVFAKGLGGYMLTAALPSHFPTAAKQEKAHRVSQLALDRGVLGADNIVLRIILQRSAINWTPELLEMAGWIAEPIRETRMNKVMIEPRPVILAKDQDTESVINANTGNYKGSVERIGIVAPGALVPILGRRRYFGLQSADALQVDENGEASELQSSAIALEPSGRFAKRDEHVSLPVKPPTPESSR